MWDRRSTIKRMFHQHINVRQNDTILQLTTTTTTTTTTTVSKRKLWNVMGDYNN